MNFFMEMNYFQIGSLFILCLLLIRDLRKWWLSRTGREVRSLRCLAWLAAAVAIAQPNLVAAGANFLGIGRGADAVLYVSVLVFIWVAFTLYLRTLRLERQITSLTRHLAIRDAEQCPAPGTHQDPARGDR